MGAIGGPPLILVALVVGLIDAATLRSVVDSSEHVVDTTAIAEISPVVRSRMLAIPDHDMAIPVPVAGAELALIVDFAKSSRSAESKDEHAAKWVRNRLCTMYLEGQCRLLKAAQDLEIWLLVAGIMSTKPTWSEVTAACRLVGLDPFWVATCNSPGIVRLRDVASTNERMAIADEVHRLLAGSADNATLVNTAEWENGANVLHWAASNGDDLVIKLLSNVPGVNANMGNKQRLTPLHAAASNGHAHIAELLLGFQDVQINARDDNGWTPLHYAAFQGHVPVAQVLLADPDCRVVARDNTGQTPLHKAAYRGHADIIDTLLPHQASPDAVGAQDHAQQTAADVAGQQGYDAIASLLRGASLKPSSPCRPCGSTMCRIM